MMGNYWTEDLEEILKPNNKIEIFYNQGNRNNKTIEVRKIVDKDYIVYRVYDIDVGEYDYYIQHIHFFYFCDRKNNLTLCDNDE